MLVTVIATLCLVADPSSCIEKTVTDQATLMQCGGAMAAQVLPQWMADNGYLARGYRLAKWGCQIGSKKTST
jgi:hypothetical protein